MLVLSRKKGEAVVIGKGVRVTVLEISSTRIKLGFSGPPQVPICREELYPQMSAKLRCAAADPACPLCVGT